MKVEIGQFLCDVALESTTYPNITEKEIGIFDTAVWEILNDSNSSQDACTIDDDDVWYIHLDENLDIADHVILTAENLSLCIQDGESIEDFAAAVVQGR